MEKRVVLFLILALLILLGYDYMLRELGLAPVPEAPEQARQLGEKSQQAEGTKEGAGSVGTTPEPGVTAARALPKDAAPISAGASETLERTEEVSTDLYRAVFTNRGATLRSWELIRYRTADPQDQRPIQLVYSEGQFPGPLSLEVPDPETTKALQGGLYTVERDFNTLDASHPTGHLTFTYRMPDTDLRVQKRLTFHYDQYLVDIEVRVEGVTDSFQVGLGTNFGIVEWGEGFIGLIGAATMVDDQLQKDTPESRVVHDGQVRWVALQDKYFLSVLLPAGGNAAVVKPEGEKILSAGVRFAADAGTTAVSLQLYAGPKKFDTLKALKVGLEDTIDFGWFIYGSWGIVKAVAKPLFYVLRFLYDFTQNYGLSIILLTVGIKLLFVPLQYKSYKSMKDMQVVQPKVVALQAKYKDDRERLNKELIKLYKDHKVNPVGGCLPMLLQMPVFVALFNILYMTIDLRQAPFILWITDLSVQDPYYVLPVLMGLSMVVQQKIMPTTMDPTQAKIMLLLPAFLTILFLTFPAGLVLYWLTNNVLTITQQFVTDRYIFKKPTFTSGSEPSAPSGTETETGDGQRPTGKGKKKKGKDQARERAEQDGQQEDHPKPQKAETDSPINTG